MVMSQSLACRPAVVQFEDLSIAGRKWSGEVRSEAFGIELSVRQEGPALEVQCKGVVDRDGQCKNMKVVFEAETVVRFSMPSRDQD